MCGGLTTTAVCRVCIYDITGYIGGFLTVSIISLHIYILVSSVSMLARIFFPDDSDDHKQCNQ